jgi:hypothetical protein
LYHIVGVTDVHCVILKIFFSESQYASQENRGTHLSTLVDTTVNHYAKWYVA